MAQRCQVIIENEQKQRRISREASEIVYAAEDGNVELVSRILSVAPGLVNTKTTAGWSALHMASRFTIMLIMARYYISRRVHLNGFIV